MPLTSDDVHVVFLLDVSRSVDLQDLEKNLDKVDEAIAALATTDTWSIFVLGQELQACVDVADARKRIDEWQDQLGDERFRDASHLSRGLRSARFVLTGSRANRMIVVSDGCNTDRDIQYSLDMLKAESVDVRFWQVDSIKETEASVVSLVPSSHRAYKGEVIRLTANVLANADMEGRLRLIHRGVVITERNVTLEAMKSKNVYFDMPMSTPGTAYWKVELLAKEDYFNINNQAAASVEVRGEPRVLIAHRDPRSMRHFSRALQEQGFTVELRDDHGIPHSLKEMLAFDAIILAEVPATSIGARGLELLRRYVADFGGGLAMFGSEESFGLGGYFRTPVEEVLPLTSRYEKEKEKPSMAMVLVIDKSGSMDGLPIALARKAAKAAVELLSARDQIAIIGFDGTPYVVCEMSPGSDSFTINAAIDGLVASGGTNMYPAMVLGADMLEATAAKIKHMIVLGDGMSQDGDFAGIATRLADQGVTVSTVALGGGADQALMAQIAEIGNGRTYVTMDPADVPQIFTKETMEASRSAIKEDIYTAVAVQEHPMMAGYTDEGLPMALGYIMTEAKPTAQLVLAHDTGDPLLAISRYGLGVGLAFTADLTERWGGEWLAWDGCGKFWAQVLRSTVRSVDSTGILVQQSIRDQEWRVRLESKNTRGEPQNNVQWDALLLDANNGELRPAVEQIGYGRYYTKVDLSGRDQASLQIRDALSNKSITLHYERPYPAEYNLSKTCDPAFLALDSLAAKDVREDIEPIKQPLSVAHWFIWLAVISMIGGVACRRI